MRFCLEALVARVQASRGNTGFAQYGVVPFVILIQCRENSSSKYIMKLFVIGILLGLIFTVVHGQNKHVYYETDFEAANVGGNALQGFEAWLVTDTLANGVIENAIPGSGKGAYIGWDISPDRGSALVTRPFASLYPHSGRPVYTVGLDFGIMDSGNGSRDIFFVDVTGPGGQYLASVLFDNESKAILTRSAATESYASTGYVFNPGVPGRLEFHLDLIADTWSATIGEAVLVDGAPLIGESDREPMPTRLSLYWSLRDQEAPGDNYLIFDNVKIAADSGPYPFIQEGPLSQGVLPGESAALGVIATGEEPMEYQWFAGAKGNTGSPVSGATAADFTTPGIDEQVSYWVRVSNAFGTVDSEAAIITPRRNPPLSVETVPVGYPGNLPDNYGPGAVDYEYYIGEYPVTNEQYAAFLNAVAADDPYGLYDERMGSEVHGGIERAGSPGSFTYEVRIAEGGYNEGQSMAPMPVNYVSFWSAARFANWLTSGDTETGVYALNGVANPPGSSGARNQTLFLNGGVAVASDDEWYKAAYHDPALNVNPDFGIWAYWDYPTKSHVISASAPSFASSVANFNDVVGTVTRVGAYASARSVYGTFDQAGNTFEWVDDVRGNERGARGGSYRSPSVGKWTWAQVAPSDRYDNAGFRVTSGAPIIRRAVLTLVRSGLGDGVVTLDGEPVTEFPQAWTFAEGSPLVLSAIPELGATFDGWGGDVSETGQTLSVSLATDMVIEVNFGRMSAPPITEQPLSRTVLSGESVTLSVTAFGDDLTYQWFVGASGDDSQPVEGATGPEYVTGPIAETISFWVRVTAADGEFTDSATAVLTVPESIGLSHWTTVVSGVTDVLYGVAWGHDRFVAVGNQGTILTSGDGWAWTSQVSGVINNLQDVAWGDGVFVAVGFAGRILTSLDGNVWTVRVSGTAATLTAVTHGPHGFVAVGSGGTILTSSDGTSWTVRTSNRTGTFTDVTWNGAHYVAVGSIQFTNTQFGIVSSPILVTSSTGVSWEVRNPPLENFYTVAGRDGETVVGAAGGSIFHSRYGVNWEPWHTGHSMIFRGSLWTGSEYVSVGSGPIMSSVDGFRWMAHPLDVSMSLFSIARSDEVLVAVGGGIVVSVVSPVSLPVITRHPASQTVATYATATLSVEATGEGLTYQWYRGQSGDVSDPIPAANGPVLTIDPVVGEGDYWVRVTEASGQFVDSAIATVIPLEVEKNLHWRWLHPLPAGVTYRGIVHTPHGFVVVGDFGTIVLSEDGEAWEVIAAPSRNALHAVIWTGSIYMAVGANGMILTSQDGRYWQERFSGTTQDLWDVTWNGERFVAVGHLGVTLTSTDGISWERSESSITATFFGVSHDGELFVAVGSSGILNTSVDGLNWADRSSGTTRTLRDVLWDGQKFIAVGSQGTVLTSPDGSVWSVGATGNTREIHKLALGGAGYLAVGSNGIILESSDAVSWSELAQGNSGEIHYDIASANGETLLVGQVGSIVVSSDLELWESRRQESRPFLREVSIGAERWAAVGNSSEILTTTGLNAPWEPVAGVPEGTSFNSICYGDGGFVAVGNSGLILASADGLNWNQVAPDVTGHLYQVRWTGDFYLATGASGTVLTSEDGEQWQARTSGVNVALRASASSADLHLIVGDSGTIFASSDGVSWTPVTSGTDLSLRGIVYTGSGFVAYANQAMSSISGTVHRFVALRSRDGLEWESRFAFTTPQGINSLHWNGKTFLAAGNQGVLWTSFDANIWTEQQRAPVALVGLSWADDHWMGVGNGGTILAAPDNRFVEGPVIVEQPGSPRAEEGQSVELTVEATGPNLQYRWYRGEAGDTSEPVAGAFGASLAVTVDAEEGLYWVRVSRAYGVSVDSVTVAVAASAPVPTFGEWAAAAGLTGEDALPLAAPSGDGVENLVKYAFNLDPTRPDRRMFDPTDSVPAGLPAIALEGGAGEFMLVLEFLRRRDSGLVYRPEFSVDLHDWIAGRDVETVEIVDEDWERVRVRQPVDFDSGEQVFGRVRVTLP